MPIEKFHIRVWAWNLMEALGSLGWMNYWDIIRTVRMVCLFPYPNRALERYLKNSKNCFYQNFSQACFAKKKMGD